MIVVISDPKTGKAYQKKMEDAGFLLNKKIGEEVGLDALGLEAFSGKIRGGSDKQGFPIHPAVPGTARRKAFLSKGIGIKPKRKGERKRKTVRGNTISNETAQVNIVVTKHGKKSIESILGKETGKAEEKDGREGAKPAGKEEKAAEEKGKKAVKPEGKKESGKAEKPKEEKPTEKAGEEGKKTEEKPAEETKENPVEEKKQ